MNKQFILVLFAFLLVGLNSCRKDSDIIKDTPDNPILEVEFEAAIQGVVYDRNGVALEGVSITLGNSLTESDENGVFLITETIQGQRALLTLRKNGYFDLQKAVMASKKGAARTIIQMTPQGSFSGIDTDTGGKVDIIGGGSVTFAPNSFEDEQGNSYNGAVKVYSSFLDPSDPEIDQFMPGDLSALDAEDAVIGLQSFGMVKIELRSEASEKVQINKPATIEFPVPSSLIGQAPQSIPLWHYDEADGFWKEEGSAQLQGTTYVGTVNHFSFWNCDIPVTVTTIEGTVSSGLRGLPLQVQVRITELSTGDRRTAYTSHEGYFSGFVPKNEELLLELLDECEIVVHSTTIGPFNDPSNLGSINVATSANWIEFDAQLVDCNQMPNPNAYVLLDIPGSSVKHFFLPDQDGNVSGIVEVCSAPTINITAYDIVNRVKSLPVTFATSATINMGMITVCDNPIEEYFLLEFDGRSYTIRNTGGFTAQSIPQTPNNFAISHAIFGSAYIGATDSVHYNALIRFNYSDSWSDGKLYLILTPISTTSDNLISYTIKETSTTNLFLTGTEPGDMMEMVWENAVIEERLGSTLLGEYVGGKVTITHFLK